MPSSRNPTNLKDDSGSEVPIIIKDSGSEVPIIIKDSGGGGEPPIIVKDSGGGSGETPIIIKDSGSEDPIIIKDSAGDDSIIIKGSGPGPDVCVNVLLSTPAKMGWTISTAGDVQVVLIPKGAGWQLKMDRLTGKAFLQIPNALIARMEVDDLVDGANPSVEVPATQAARLGDDPEIEIHFASI
jgi:hypothetical protein